ncbi:MAG TPA: aminotransferase class V-fold PLP-dependent enzyme [Puia sp.]|jgi:selenocysteine lyase/cysteine desulfurase
MNIITGQELLQFRKETKGTAKKIHFNNAGSSLPPDVVVDTVVNYLQEEAVSGGYETEAKYQQQLDDTYPLIARLINASPDEIAIVENASQAWGLAFNGIGFKTGDVIITSEMEYVTNLLGFLLVQKTYGVTIKVIPNDASGNFSLPDLEAAITPQTRLIAITHIASAAGGMTPIEDIGNIARKHGILYLVDACQTAGQVPIDVQAIGCDILSVTGRKYLRAPRGTGFLYVRKNVQADLNILFMDGHTAQLNSENDYVVRDDGRRFELYEKNRALTLGLAKAIEYALNIGVDRIWQRIQFLANSMREQLKSKDFITVHDIGQYQCGIVTFSVNDQDSREIKNKLFQKDINVSVGFARSTLLYMNKNHLSSIIRASVHYYNTEEEIKALCDALTTIAGH